MKRPVSSLTIRFAFIALHKNGVIEGTKSDSTLDGGGGGGGATTNSNKNKDEGMRGKKKKPRFIGRDP